jgi:NADPH:quinone reductase
VTTTLRSKELRAAWFESFGAARDVLQIGELEKPEANPGQVLVRVHTSSVNPSDVKKRAGSFPDLLDKGLIVPNSDGAGQIEAVGAGVDANRIGERVWLYQAQFGRRFGTAAEYIAIDAIRAVKLPDQVGYEVGACLGIPAMTAHRAVFADGDVAGHTILITGGAGRVGYYAIQWAKRAGATVIASAGNAADKEACQRAGALHVVDHRGDDVAGQILEASRGRPVDRVVDVEFGANLAVTLEVIRVGGVVASYASAQVPKPALPFYRMMYKDLTLRCIIVYAMPEAAKQTAIADIGAALSQGTLQHRIAETRPLSEIANSNDVVEQGRIRGAMILNIE